MTTRRDFLVAATLIVAAPLTSSLPLAEAQAEKDKDKVQLMFVQTADDLKADDKTLRLVNVGKQTLYFSDRPKRIAGHLTMQAYMEEWKAGEGPDNFASDPPNATLSVYEAGQAGNTLTVVEISHPVIEGNDLIYHYKLIEGTMPKSGGATALFIDWVGVGGGVGAGFHGVGAGTRGVGLYGGVRWASKMNTFPVVESRHPVMAGHDRVS
jgi:hypothetical protein